MSTALHYKSNLRDIFFNLFEFLRIQDNVLGKEPFAALDEASARDALTTLDKLCTSDLALSFVDSDRIPLKLDDNGNVTIQPTVRAAIERLTEGGWIYVDTPERLGGLGASATVGWAAYELMVGANPCATFYTSFGPMVARVIDSCGTDKQKKLFVDSIIQKNWGGTMVLTEPEAGSDVGAARTKARHVSGDVYEIEGVKRFITSGDWDLPENIVHLVLARPEGAGPGTKGLSLFIVPKYWVNDDGSLGERNGVYCKNLEKKMGIKGSATCEMAFGGQGKPPARGRLVGEVHDGIRQMFLMIEHARMAVGCKSMSTLSTGYLNALEYAKVRVQGPDLAKAADKASPRVRIIEHPDVRRMLMELKAHAEGMRALCMFTASTRDSVEILRGTDPAASQAWDHVNDLLLPLVKGYCSDRAFDLLGVALQVYGGSGYCQDYPIEQYIRDQKIDTLYEGTTHIQSIDLIFRKVLRDGGKTLTKVLSQAVSFAKSDKGGAALSAERAAVGKSLADMEALFGALQKKMGEDVYHAGFQANRVLYALSETLIGWLLAEHASLAVAKLAEPGLSSADKAFYQGKVASAKYFAHEVLPRVTLLRKLIETGTTELRSLPEEAF